ncbi:MAG: 30S ribosomal protein S3 [Bacteroidetes bacterium]|jgi:small subunit ribosomal protein S3|nr:30S ribosomal protein S3 [Bacteroidota bacterium]
MGQKTHPTGLRLGIVKGWESNWFGGKNYVDKIVEDEKIRNYLAARIPRGGIAKVVIERTLRRLIITIHTARPGIVIGRAGQEVEKLKEEIKKLTDKEVQINIFEVKRPEIDAQLIADNVAQQLQARISFRRAMKSAISSGMRMGAEGVKVMCSGRLGGADMSRTEMYKEGRVPLQTLRADIDYATSTARTVYGAIGVKVWVFKGELYGKIDLSPEAQNGKGKSSARGAARGGDRPPRGGDRPARGGDRPARGGDRPPRGGGDRGGRPGGPDMSQDRNKRKRK